MKRRLKVLIGDNSLSLGVICAEELSKYEVDVDLVPRDGMQILEKIKSTNPDIVVMSAYLTKLDAIGIVRNIAQEKDINPQFIVTNSYTSQYVEDALLSLGIAYYMLEPIDAYSLCGTILEMGGIKSRNYGVSDNQGETDLETVVTEVILNIGIPAHVKGYHYTRRAIMLCIENSEMINLVTKLLYPTIAKEFNTTPSRVERAIRHAIEIAWDRGNVDTLNSYFGYTINVGRGKPTNSEFIAMIADKLRLQLKKNNLLQKKL